MKPISDITKHESSASSTPRQELTQLFTAAVQSVEPAAMVQSALQLRGNTLLLQAADQQLEYDLSGFSRILALGIGKAGASMAQGLEAVLGDRLVGGLVAVKQGHSLPLHYIELIEAAHPVPDDSSLIAAERLLELARAADEQTLVLVLISGGGSAIACAPLCNGTTSLSLADKAAITKALLASGADITEVNTVRRHFSAFKGGRLAEALFPASSLTLILSDVIGDDLNAIASGPTVPDPSSWQDVAKIIDTYRLADSLPLPATALLAAGLAGNVADTPKPGSAIFNNAKTAIIGSNRLAALAAVQEAESLGYDVVYLGSSVCGDAEEVARWYFKLALEQVHLLDGRMVKTRLPGVDQGTRHGICLIGGGETTVLLQGDGKGGRNQQLALRFLACLAELALSDPATASRISFLSAGTDGNDGPTDAAGAFAELTLVHSAITQGMDPEKSLVANDAYNFFAPLDGLLLTGPTNTNVCDLQLVLIQPQA